MNRSSTDPTPRLCLSAALVVFFAVVGCSDGSDDSSEGDVAASVAPEALRLPMEEVIQELPTMVAGGETAAAAAASGNFDAALEDYEELHEVWEGIEGTVKETDANSYERIETAQGLIRDGAENEDAQRVQQGADDQSEAVDTFVAANGP